MTLEELKDQNVSAVERAKAVVSALGLKGDERSVVVGLSKGDKFKLVAMNKVDLQMPTNQTKATLHRLHLALTQVQPLVQNTLRA